MLQWVKKDRTLICLVAQGVLETASGLPIHDADFYDDDLGFYTARAYRPMTEEEGREKFGHLRLA